MIRQILNFIRLSLKRKRLLSIINIIGLVFGISAFFLISSWLSYNLSFENFNREADNIFRVVTDIEGGQSNALSVYRLSSELREKYPQVLQSCRIASYRKTTIIKKDDKIFNEQRIISADSNLFDIMSYRILNGNRKTILKGPNKILLSETMAGKYFGNEYPVGKIITLFDGSVNKYMEVSGVFQDLPANTHLRFDFVTSDIIEKDKYKSEDAWFNWELLNWNTYIQLSHDMDYNVFETLVRDFVKQNHPTSKYRLKLQPLKKIYLHSGDLVNANIVGETGSIKHVRILSAVAVIILLTAYNNFILLAFACSMSRIKISGIKKIHGSNRRTLVTEFILESILFVLIATSIAIIFNLIALPLLNQYTGLNLSFGKLGHLPKYWLILMVFLLPIPVSFYPALKLNSVQPAIAIRGMTQFKIAGVPILKSLLILQLVVSLVLISCTMLMNRQIKYILNFDTGLNTDNVIYFSCEDIPYDYRTGIDIIKNELMKIPSIISVTCGSEMPISINNYIDDTDWDGKSEDNKTRFHYLKTDHDFLKTFNIQLIGGRDFSHEIVSDDSAYIINESAAKAMNIESPLGKNLIYIFRGTQKIPGKIIGITRDFHFNSLYTTIEPLVIGTHIGRPGYIIIRTNKMVGNSSILEIDKTVKSLCPEKITEYKVFNESIKGQYGKEIQTGKIFEILSILAIIITLLGLFGHSVFSLQLRRNEVGIRKVNGADTKRIVMMLIREFIRLLIIAFLIAIPIVLIIMNNWLHGFAYKVNFNFIIFLYTGLLMLSLVIITVLWQSVRLASLNAIDVIKSE